MAKQNSKSNPKSKPPKSERMEGEPSDILRCMAALKALEEKIDDLRAVIASILELYHSMPEGESKDQLLIEISSLDAIADTMQKAFDSMKEE